MPVVPRATVRPTILAWRCRPREPLPRNPAPRNLGPSKQTRPTAKLLLRPILMNLSSLITKKRRKSIGKKKPDQKNSSPTIGENAIEGKKDDEKCYNCQKGLYCEKLPGTSKKLVSVLATSVPITDCGEKVVKVPCIYYLVRFQEGQG